MFAKRDLQDLMETVSQLPIQTFKYSDGKTKIVIKKDSPVSEPQKYKKALVNAVPEETTELQTPQPQISTQAEAVQESPKSDLIPITAPMVGTFYRYAEQGGSPLVQVGDKVTAETVVCVLEAMKLFMEIKARVSGEIVEIVAEEGRLVEYGQTLFLIKPE